MSERESTAGLAVLRIRRSCCRRPRTSPQLNRRRRHRRPEPAFAKKEIGDVGQQAARAGRSVALSARRAAAPCDQGIKSSPKCQREKARRAHQLAGASRRRRRRPRSSLRSAPPPNTPAAPPTGFAKRKSAGGGLGSASRARVVHKSDQRGCAASGLCSMCRKWTAPLCWPRAATMPSWRLT